MNNNKISISNGRRHGCFQLRQISWCFLVAAYGNKLGLIEGDAEGESVLGRQFENVRSFCSVCNH